MAAKQKDSGNIYPRHIGEYCGNHCLNSQPTCFNYQTQDEADRSQKEFLSRMRFGLPRPCKAGTSEEMKKIGYVGLYLLKDSNLSSNEERCPTPPELMEPGQEHLYNTETIRKLSVTEAVCTCEAITLLHIGCLCGNSN